MVPKRRYRSPAEQWGILPRYHVIIAGGEVLDPANTMHGVADIGIADGKIVEVAPELDRDAAREVIDASGSWVMPGLIDTHTHFVGAASTWNPALGYRALARAGTTTAIDFGGTPEQLIDSMRKRGSGLNAGGLFIMNPEMTIPQDDPPPRAIREIVAGALEGGALGIKMSGGYHPFTPEVTANTIAACNAQRAYVAFHVGTKESGSRIDGLREVPALVGNGRLHVAHINAYCRGSINRPEDECDEALQILIAKKGQYVSEVHQAIPNGTQGRCDKNGNVLANVAQNCLRLRGYEITADGIRQAIKDGYASAIQEKNDRVVYVGGDQALALFNESGTDVSLTFPVNLPSSAFRLTTARDDDGDFVIDAVCTDGGWHPRNIAIESTMALVKFGALSPSDMAEKLSWNPSRMFGLLNKGHFSPGADADVTVIDPEVGRATIGMVAGMTIMKDGESVADGGTVLTTLAGERAVAESGLPYEVVDLTQSKLYAGYEN